MSLTSASLTDAARARAKRSEYLLQSCGTKVWKYPAKTTSKGTVLFIHGYRGTHHGMEAIVGALDDFDCVVPDLPGFGESDQFLNAHTLQNYANWLEELVVELSTRNLLVVGHSFGTLVVSQWARTHHEHPIALINPVSSPALSGPRTFLTRLTAAFYALSSKLPERAGRWLLSHPIAVWAVTEFMYRADGPELKRWIALQHRTYFSRFASLRSVTEGFRASISQTVSEAAPEISQPTLLICCERDDLTAIEVQRKVAGTFAQATYVEVPKLGHLIHYEGPEIAAKHIREFYPVAL